MRYFIVALLILFTSCNKVIEINLNPPAVVKPDTTATIVKSDSTIVLTTQEISFSQNGVTTDSLYGSLTESTPGALNYVINGVEHLILTPSLPTRTLSPLHFVKKNGQWVFTGNSYEVSLGNPRNYKIDVDGTIYYAEQGLEYSTNGKLPFGDLWKVTTYSFF